jgi:hypothetical protein
MESFTWKTASFCTPKTNAAGDPQIPATGMNPSSKTVAAQLDGIPAKDFHNARTTRKLQ